MLVLAHIEILKDMHYARSVPISSAAHLLQNLPSTKNVGSSPVLKSLPPNIRNMKITLICLRPPLAASFANSCERESPSGEIAPIARPPIPKNWRRLVVDEEGDFKECNSGSKL